MELDGDDIAVTYIKEVIFNANQPDVEILRMTKVLSKLINLLYFTYRIVVLWFWFLLFNDLMLLSTQPPFVMDKWMVGMQQNQRVDYTVNYEVSQFSFCGTHFTKTKIYTASC